MDSCCAVCQVEFTGHADSGQERRVERVTSIISKGPSVGDDVTIIEALALVFEAHLKLNNVSDLSDTEVGMCQGCADLLGDLYSSYVHILSLAKEESLLRQLFIKESILWNSPPSRLCGLKQEDSSHHIIKEEILTDDEGELDDVVLNSLQIDHEVDSDEDYVPPNEVLKLPVNPRNTRSSTKSITSPGTVRVESLSKPRSKVNLRLQALIGKQRKKQAATAAAAVKKKKKPTRYRCLHCQKRFPSTASLQVHIQSKHPTHLITCSLCPLKFLTQRQHSIHCSKVHPGNTKLNECPVCQKVFTSPQHMRRHRDTHDDPTVLLLKKTHACTVEGCSFRAVSASKIKNHLLSHSDEKTFKCSLCTNAYKGWRALRRHENAVHGKGGIKEGRTCPECGRYFSLPSLMKQHLKTVHHGTKEHACDQCDKKYTTNYALVAHKESHIPPEDRVIKMHHCSQCPKSYPSRQTLNYHVKAVHEKRRDFICEDCGKGFPCRTDLKNHREVHRPDRQRTHQCPHCEKAFLTKHSWGLHVKTHTTKSEHLCSECGMSFTAHASLGRHMASQHSVFGSVPGHQGPFKCELCGKLFKLKEYLAQHMRSKAHGGTGRHSNSSATTSTSKRIKKEKVIKQNVYAHAESSSLAQAHAHAHAHAHTHFLNSIPFKHIPFP